MGQSKLQLKTLKADVLPLYSRRDYSEGNCEEISPHPPQNKTNKHALGMKIRRELSMPLLHKQPPLNRTYVG